MCLAAVHHYLQPLVIDEPDAAAESDQVMLDTLAAATDASGELPPGPHRADAARSDATWGLRSWPSPKM